jgi:hypothetical protein
MEFGEIADLRRPVVHLGVDVEVPVAIPRGLDLIRPESLQIGWQPAGPGRRDQEVASVVEIECGEGGVGHSGLEALQPLRRRPCRGWPRPRGPVRGTRVETSAGSRRHGRGGGRLASLASMWSMSARAAARASLTARPAKVRMSVAAVTRSSTSSALRMTRRPSLAEKGSAADTDAEHGGKADSGAAFAAVIELAGEQQAVRSPGFDAGSLGPGERGVEGD